MSQYHRIFTLVQLTNYTDTEKPYWSPQLAKGQIDQPIFWAVELDESVNSGIAQP
ncbi:hypothetical protein [Ammoniphilus oxalaticus]|uniref:hypothetical protein n=1 Tax=Ammoniphilus oxalaticus TaxID=66863 RepID=UPI0014732E3B|nr:hypothetical protein [Ammoniphilus oxalaticus]